MASLTSKSSRSRRPKSTQQLVRAMAYNRQTFKDRVEEKIGGALLEHYKACLAERNGLTQWIEHWRGEVKRLIDTELVVVLLHDIRGFRDRRKAFGEVLTLLRIKDDSYRGVATRIVLKDFGLKKLRHLLDDQATEEFYRHLTDVAETILGSGPVTG